MSQGEAAIGSLKSQRKGALETGSGVWLPSIPLVACPMGALRVKKKLIPDGEKEQVHSKTGTPTV